MSALISFAWVALKRFPMGKQVKAMDTSVHLAPGSNAYEACLSGLVNGTAAAQMPRQIRQPRSTKEIQTAIRDAAALNLKISVRGGSHSAHCASNNSLMLDLAASYKEITISGDRVRIQAGANMGAVVQALSPYGRTIPVGTHTTPGFGLLLMGGIGHLSRILGLTIDAIEELHGFRSNGEPFKLTATTGEHEDWKLMRGAAIFLGVVTEATLRTFPRYDLRVCRELFTLDQLSDEIANAENFPASAACSMILGFPQDHPHAMGLIYAVAETNRQESMIALDGLKAPWQDIVAGQEQLPPFEMPQLDGRVESILQASVHRMRRTRTWVYSISLPNGLAEKLGPILKQSINSAPNRDCRIDLQHVGGLVNTIPEESSAYLGRSAEWSIVITGVWPGTDGIMAKRVRDWADILFKKLIPLAIHYYIVQRHPGDWSYPTETRLAYGPIWEQLNRRKTAWDSLDLLPSLI